MTKAHVLNETKKMKAVVIVMLLLLFRCRLGFENAKCVFAVVESLRWREGGRHWRSFA